MYRMSKILEKSIQLNSNNYVPALILEKIVKTDGISRARLAKEHDISKTIISKKVNELINNKIIVETGKGNNNLGKKEILLDINKDYKNIFVIDFSKNQLTVGLYDLKKNTIFEKSFEYPKPEEISSILSKIIFENSNTNLIETVIISMPSIVRGLQVFNLNNDEILGVFEATKQFCFENYFKVKIYNDIDLEAIAIKESEKFLKTKNLVVLSGHNGIGGSVIIDEELFSGENSLAGEFCYLNPRIVDGETSNFETRNSLKAIYKDYNKNNKEISLVEFKELIKKKHQSILGYYENLFEELKTIIINISCTVDINTFVLSGDLFSLYPNFKEEITSKIRVFSGIKNNIEIKIFSKNNQSLIGAKILGVNYTINNYFQNMN